ARTFRNVGVQDVLVHLPAFLGLVGVGLLLGFDVDRGTVVGGRDRAGQEGAVVVGVVPGEAALVAGFLPQGYRVLDRLQGLLAGDRHGLAVGFDFLAAERPQRRIPPARRVAEGVTRGLAERAALGLQLAAGIEQGIPGLGKLVVPDFLEP